MNLPFWTNECEYPLQQVADSVESLFLELGESGYHMTGNPKSKDILVAAIRSPDLQELGTLNWGKLCIDHREQFKAVIVAQWILAMWPDLGVLAEKRRGQRKEILEFKTWKKWVAEFGRCQATTAKGHQCKNSCAGMGSDICNDDDFHNIEFVMGDTDRCRVHQLVSAPKESPPCTSPATSGSTSTATPTSSPSTRTPPTSADSTTTTAKPNTPPATA